MFVPEFSAILAKQTVYKIHHNKTFADDKFCQKMSSLCSQTMYLTSRIQYMALPSVSARKKLCIFKKHCRDWDIYFI